VSGAYYNELDPFCAAWLRNLIDAGLIAKGEVDERDIRTVSADELLGFTQCHFFAGIGGWSLALRLAGWDDERPVWTGSCPCQPFSTAGRGEGLDDARHLWPAWCALIRERRPVTIFGEQVAQAARGSWLDLVSADLEALGYAVGATILPACGVGAPHIRGRLWFVADAKGAELSWSESEARRSVRHRATRLMADAGIERREGIDALLLERRPLEAGAQASWSGAVGSVADTDGKQEHAAAARGLHADVGSGSAWSDAEYIQCSDGYARLVEPGTFPLAPRLPGDVGRLRAYGNAIVPQVGAAFVAAFMECRP
jgi:DNA (cytosine-5)-methyltransferase 1